MRPRRSFPDGTLERLQRALKEARSKAEFQRVQWFVVARGAGVKCQPGCPSLGVAADCSAASAGPVLAARGSSVAASWAGRPTPSEPDPWRRSAAVGRFSGARRAGWIAGGQPCPTGLGTGGGPCRAEIDGLPDAGPARLAQVSSPASPPRGRRGPPAGF